MQNRVVMAVETLHKGIMFHIDQIQVSFKKLTDPSRNGLFIDSIQGHNQNQSQNNIPTYTRANGGQEASEHASNIIDLVRPTMLVMGVVREVTVQGQIKCQVD